MIKKKLGSYSAKIRSYTAKLQPWWMLIGAPITQELTFRYIPYQYFFLPNKDNYWTVGIISSLLFAPIHYYFGLPIVLGIFIAGLIYWWSMVNYGLFASILTHAMVNFLIFVFWREKWFQMQNAKKTEN